MWSDGIAISWPANLEALVLFYETLGNVFKDLKSSEHGHITAVFSLLCNTTRLPPNVQSFLLTTR